MELHGERLNAFALRLATILTAFIISIQLVLKVLAAQLGKKMK